ncbi:MAG: CDP-alcohol phosphatidyltransferase family protein [Verrucomicrobiales bacterium]|nr:CDP-alcohol phosphatidyltransferase family protein [Verrucomicrobiales bacterium]
MASPCRRVTLATKITLFRILLIPVFIGTAVYYADSVSIGQPNENLRWSTVGIFGLAALSDAVDGFIARHYNQRSRIGAILDPLADKLLLLSAIFTLTFTSWPQRFPLWFPLLVVFRDLAAIGGAFLIQHFSGQCTIRPHWTGKVATFTQIAAVLWIMLDLRTPPILIPALIAGAFTAISGFIYLAEGIRQIQHPPTA